MDFGTSEAVTFSEGWQGFTDFAFIINAFLTLGLSTILSAIIGYHPRNVESADTLLDIEAPKVYILCSVIGAIIGILVVKYGLVVGFVIFGIGGLIRFRTILGSANLTGHVIFSTLIGLSCGLNLPHVAVLSTFFVFGLIYVLDIRVTYRIEIMGVHMENLVESANTYRHLLEAHGCKVVSEKKSLSKETLTLIFHCSRKLSRNYLEELLEREVKPPLKGAIDWEIE